MASNQSSEHGPLPLVVGVTGHRDLREDDYPVLEEKVREKLAQITSSYPHTQIILLSPLAEGADRLAARIALQSEKIRLVVPLPMRKELYQKDFSKPGSREEFDKILSQATQSFVLPVVDGRSEEIGEEYSERDLQYEQVGAYVVRHSQILIALWDGMKTNLVGGTSKIVQFQQEGVPEPYAPHRTLLDVVESGLVYHIVTRRAREMHQTRGEPFTTATLLPKGYAADAGDYDRIFKDMDTFNSDALRQGPLLQREMEESMDMLFPEEEARKLPDTLQTLRKRYAVADTLAVYFKGLTRSTLNRLFILITVAAFSFAVYANLLTDWHEILFFYLFIIAIAHLWVYRRAHKKKKYQTKYQDYRTVAEGLRVQFFWCLASLSLKHFNLSVADHYLRKQKSELDWIRHAIRVWNIPEAVDDGFQHPAADSPRMSYLDLLLKHWVREQAEFFTRRAKEDQETLERNERWSRILLWSGVGVTILLAMALLVKFYLLGNIHEPFPHDHLLHGGLLLLMTLPPLGAALLHSYTEKTALSEHVKQYSRMSGLFSNAERQLRALLHPQRPRDGQRRTKDIELARELIEELGKEALAENGDWVLLHRERLIDPPHVV